MRAVELAQKAQQQFWGFLEAKARPQEGPTVQHRALAHEQHTKAQPAAGIHYAHHVQVAPARQHGGLALHGAFHGADLVAQYGGPFEFQRLGGGFHLPAQLPHQFARAAREQHFHPLHQRGVLVLRHVEHARGKALPYKMIQAGAHPVFQCPVRAAAQGKGAVDGLPRGAGRPGGGERAVVLGAVAPHGAYDVQARVGMLFLQAKEHVLLVVAQHDVVAGPVLLDKAGLQQQRLLFGGGAEGIQPFGLAQHGQGLGGLGRRGALGGLAKVGRDAFAQVLGLAHVQDAPGGVLVQVDAGSIGNARHDGLLHAEMGRPAGAVPCVKNVTFG